jgi:hypothetical protein
LRGAGTGVSDGGFCLWESWANKNYRLLNFWSWPISRIDSGQL